MKTLITLLPFLLLLACEGKNPPQQTKYIAGEEGVNLSAERQNQAFGKWQLTNMIITNYQTKEKKKIAINIPVIIEEKGIFSNNQLIANKHQNSIGTYYFQNLDTLNTAFYIRDIEESKMLMTTPTLWRVVNGKLSKEKIKAKLFFVKNYPASAAAPTRNPLK